MSGSLIVDIVLVIVALASLFSGWKQGGFAAALSFMGVLAGGFLSVTSVPWVLDLVTESSAATEGMRFIAALITVVVGVVVGYALGSVVGQKLRDQIKTRQALIVESSVGAIVQVVTVLLVIWLISIPLVNGQNSGFARSVKGSAILGAVSDIAPESLRELPMKTSTFIGASGFPVITDPLDNAGVHEVDPPDAALQNDPVVKASRQSIVRVVGEAEQCSRMLQGSGFAVAPDTIMTNAHVVAGTDKVQVDSTQGLLSATVTYYNPMQDIALLTVDNAAFTPLPWAPEKATHGDDALVIGFPQGGPYHASPARVRDALTISGPNIYADERVERGAYSLRGNVVQGNSGGPLLNRKGEVLGLVFGADVNQNETGYALTKDEVMKHVGDVTAWDAPVETGACVLH